MIGEMTSLLFSIILAALLSTSSLLVVLFRVSPLTAPAQALPAFFLSLFLSISTIMALVFAAAWKWALPQHWNAGKLLSISLREGLFLGMIAVILIGLLLLNLLNWWIAIMVVAVFVLLEAALHS
jgi:hypothetical protein